MANSFAELRKRSKTDLADLKSKMNNTTSGRSNPEQDGTYWKPTTDKAGNGAAIIRFLPAAPDSDSPFVRGWDHGFKGPNGWYIEESLTTVGENDPVSEYNSMLWDRDEAGKKQARKQKRRQKFYSNIYVVSDPANPDAEGKVFKYRYGIKIFEKIQQAGEPDEIDKMEGKEGFNPFDLWAGANFRLRVKPQGEFLNYDDSSFGDCGPLFDDDDKMEAIWRQCHDIDTLVDPANTERFKSYDDLEKKLRRVLGLTASDMQGGQSSSDLGGTADAPQFSSSESSFSESPIGEDDLPDFGSDDSDSDSDSDEDEELSFFQNLAKEEV